MGFIIQSKDIAVVDGLKPVIEAKGLGVKYLDGGKRDDLQSLSYDFFFRRKTGTNDIWALKDIAFQGYPGDILGIIGPNGAGKTTLCKVISGLLRPDAGTLRVEGDVSALFALGVGFNQQLSGRENIFLNGMMLGFSRKYLEYVSEQIIDFAGLQEFIDQPLKHYSSGMKARLGFSIAATSEPEILVLDEALNAGDLDYSKKAAEKMQEIVKKAKLVMVVTHQLDFVQKYCTRALWIDKGVVRAQGKPQEVIALYKASIPVTNRPRKRPVEFIETKNQTHKRLAKVVSVNNLGVCFSLRSSGNDEKKLSTQFKRTNSFWALSQVKFSVFEGEIVGVIGPNGAGKSTLCRVLTGILKPEKGSLTVNGQTTALLSLGTGFDHQLTGKDNVFLNGMMLGISKRKLKTVYNNIVDFSGLEKSINKPIKKYSSGMRARLGFSIAAMLKPDLFIIDEALSVGDQSFYEKASAKIQELIGRAKAVIVVTHNMDFVEKVCTRAIWLENGIIKFDGSSKEAVRRYKQSTK